jgi:glycerol-3-phosphate acyltransferase PlsY
LGPQLFFSHVNKAGRLILFALYAGSYFVGAIPFAVLLGRLKGVDILKSGSGNPGMTNVWRTLGLQLGLLCFLLDIFKGLGPTLVARWLIHERAGMFDPQFIWFTVGVAALIGHTFSVFLHFKGGKAVSTSLGTILGASPLVGLSCFATFLLVLAITRYVAVASVLGVASVILYNRIFPGQSLQLIPVFVLLTLLVIFRHRANFKRILNHTEPKVRFPLKSKRVAETIKNDQ